ncbi:hypothetical protein DFH29DRAFT_799184 [Suillus ampliporus]|nr:hypothetical protein DFH29DRAFT_799184 [Suillus ampliporus]
MTPAQFWVGQKFYQNAFKVLRHGTTTMDILVMIGTSVAYFYLLFALLFVAFNTTPDFHPFIFFDTSTMLIMFVSLGYYLKNHTKGKTSTALTDLMALAPSMATIKEALMSKAPIQAFMDCVAGFFVPTVILLVVLTFAVWMVVLYVISEDKLPAMFHHHGTSQLAVCLQMCISVVVVACLCALGLSDCYHG